MNKLMQAIRSYKFLVFALLAVLVVASSGVAGAGHNPDDPVSYWPAEGNANDVHDNNHGTLVNGATFASGKVGQAFRFDGVDDHLRIPFATNLGVSQWSVSAWVKPAAQVNDPGNQELIFGQNFARAQLVVRPGTSGVQVVWQFGATDGSFPGVTGASEIPIGQFSHLAGTWDGTTLKLYINGALSAQSTPGKTPKSLSCPYFMGGFQETVVSGCVFIGQFFSGLIDEMQFNSRALSATEIRRWPTWRP